MTNDEFELNKDLLKEIASKRKDIKDTTSVSQMNGTKTFM